MAHVIPKGLNYSEFLVVKSTDYMRMQGHADASKCTAIEAFPEAC